MPEPTHTQVSRASMKRFAAPDEIAKRIVLIASSKASFTTTGHIFNVDGGKTVN